MEFMRSVAILAILGAQEPKVPEAVKKAEVKLEASPDDPAANLVVGRYLVFDRGDWEKGLPHLVKASDKVLAGLAQKDQEGAKTGPERVGLGDEWAKAAAKFPKERTALLDRANRWYAAAWLDLDDAWRSKLRDKLHKVAGVPADPERSAKGLPAPPGWMGFSELTGSFLEDRFAFAGRRSGRMTTWKDPKGPNSWMTVNKFRVQAGKEYELAARVLSDSADASAELQLRFYDDSGKSLGQVGPTVEGDLPLWKKYAAKGKAPEGATWADVCFWSRLKGGVFWIDEVAVSCEGRDILKNGFEDK